MKNKNKKLILALGESTHTHIMTSTKEIAYEDPATDESIKFLLEGTGVITHEEHDRQVLTPGKYAKTNQVEFNPMDGTTSRVFD